MASSITDPVKKLRIYVLLLTALVVILMGIVIVQILVHPKTLTAERIDIVNPDGEVAMVISNAARQHPGRMDKHNLPRRARPAGIIFFNDEGDECGGLVAGGNRKGADMSFTMDQYKNDQILELGYTQQNDAAHKIRSYGLTLNDRDEYALLQQLHYFDSLKRLKDTAALNAGVQKFKAANHLAQRLFLGKLPDGNVGLFLKDSKGQLRLGIYVDNQNKAVIESVDSFGKVHRFTL